jgi:hypothetical protein
MLDKTERTSLALTPRGQMVALTYRLRQAIETLPPEQGAALLAELRQVVAHYAPPRRPQPLVGRLLA